MLSLALFSLFFFTFASIFVRCPVTFFMGGEGVAFYFIDCRCRALSYTNESMTDVGVHCVMEPVIYFPISAGLASGQAQPRYWQSYGKRFMPHTPLPWLSLSTHTHTLLPPCCWQTDVCRYPQEWESEQWSVIESLLSMCNSLLLFHCGGTHLLPISFMKSVSLSFLIINLPYLCLFPTLRVSLRVYFLFFSYYSCHVFKWNIHISILKTTLKC